MKTSTNGLRHAKTCLMSYANIKSRDQLHISAIIINSLVGIICKFQDSRLVRILPGHQSRRTRFRVTLPKSDETP